jgi:hypothetical protein
VVSAGDFGLTGALGRRTMATINFWMEKHHRAIIFSLAFVVVFFATACTFHDVIPICHYVFGCDHGLHGAV